MPTLPPLEVKVTLGDRPPLTGQLSALAFVVHKIPLGYAVSLGANMSLALAVYPIPNKRIADLIATALNAAITTARVNLKVPLENAARSDA
jgi:hypothetical protein